ncbi:proline-rich protein HaeIII subfamily 1-like [Canis lupus familiaris]|uniref:proline-rich protein HaeIII subfamily 1-like n=1 Tax=Canis lupus familiaris TaxID=9615 RepID=UPI00005A563B|nr:proline-rich protein HaeIII subfamily 1-like [Canis lupus familiaris]XP_038300538.1 proline-rich protein HaeIII subfamily 1-like [Canis lupus familiaris]|eukprot:XP_013965646.1 proline-rich protein HaeIII subfamily 1-like [Canis lupus familiaris]
MAPNSKKTGGWLPRGPGLETTVPPLRDNTYYQDGPGPVPRSGTKPKAAPPPSSPQRWQKPGCGRWLFSFPRPSGVPARDLPAHPRPSLHLAALPGEAAKTAVPPGRRPPEWGARGLREGDGARGDVHRDQRGASPHPTRRGAPPAGQTPSTQMPRTGLGDRHAGPSGNGRLSPAHGALVAVTVMVQAGRKVTGSPRSQEDNGSLRAEPAPTSSPPASASPRCL